MRLFLPLPFLLITFFSFSQNTTGTISGTIVDSLSGAPLAAATVQYFREGKGTSINAIVADEKGRFSFIVPKGNYQLLIAYAGYKEYQSKWIPIGNQSSATLGLIKLSLGKNTLEEIVVQAEKSSMQLSLDKKIFNVGKDLANAGGSAMNILMNIPSVSNLLSSIT